jgi:hypothetical protein
MPLLITGSSLGLGNVVAGLRAAIRNSALAVINLVIFICSPSFRNHGLIS